VPSSSCHNASISARKAMTGFPLPTSTTSPVVSSNVFILQSYFSSNDWIYCVVWNSFQLISGCSCRCWKISSRSGVNVSIIFFISIHPPLFKQKNLDLELNQTALPVFEIDRHFAVKLQTQYCLPVTLQPVLHPALIFREMESEA